MLLDGRLPDQHGIDVCRDLKSRSKAPGILFLTSFADHARVRAAMQAGADGKTDKEIAQMLGLQPKTVRNYLDRAFEKLGVHTRTEAAILFDRRHRP